MKRGAVPFDRDHFKKLESEGVDLSTKEKFQQIFDSNHWSGGESISGQGSASNQTEEIGRRLPLLIKQLGIDHFLDVPCGDFHWLSQINLNITSYTGGDIVDKIVEKNQQYYGNTSRQFCKIDLINDPLPDADLLFCRDCLVHLSNEDVTKVLDNIRRSKITFLLTTTFTDCPYNADIVTGDWRVMNLQKPPFNLPPPLEIINENCTEGNGTYADKSLALWRISDL